MKQRNNLLDVLKGFSISLVVLGHSIQYNQINSFDDSFIFRLIYSFHMPLFMFISGWVSYKTFDGSLAKLFKRFKSLIIPFWAWFLVTFIFTYFMYLYRGGIYPNFIDSLKAIIKSPDIGLWFLWVLFLNYLVLFFSIKLNSKREEIIMFLFLIGINVFLMFTNLNFLGLSLLSWHLSFYLLGYLINKYLDKLKKAIKIIGLISLFLFPLLVIFWYRTSSPIFIDNLNIFYKAKLILYFIYKYAVPITGIFATYLIFEWILNYKFILNNYLMVLGNLSLEVYSTHFYFLSFIFLIEDINLYIRIPITFLMALFGSLFIQFIIKKSNLLSTILYGKYNLTKTV